ncbi:hypothetical protein BUALT_Bualt18G0041300 [Buddleja alternifolia]|uniref:Polyprotein n=1 Tax=Buddleja alternifolia TaxID=168488 RepID=A0AAV6WAY0_9LAMI|nr:hypothetical protein BUALT_Bualt18G0041300 [Buddleja alternifolia]
MVDTRSSDVRKDMDTLVEQVWIDREVSEKGMTELRTMIGNLVAYVAGNRTNGARGSQDHGVESHTPRDNAGQGHGYNMPTKCSTVEFPDLMLRTSGVGFSDVSNFSKWMRPHLIPNKKRQLFLMEVGKENEEGKPEDEEVEINNREQEGEEDTPTDFHISVHVMSGVHDYRTMRVTGHVGGQTVHILIDTRSTHNFLDVNAAKRLECKIVETELFPVSVADGNKIYSSSVCKYFSWKMQGVFFMTDLMLLPLWGCDMVLGVQWFIQLGDINWNFDKLNLEFMTHGQKVTLKGKKSATIKVVGENKMRKIIQKPAQIFMLHLGLLSQGDPQLPMKQKELQQETSHPQLHALEVEEIDRSLKNRGNTLRLIKNNLANAQSRMLP